LFIEQEVKCKRGREQALESEKVREVESKRRTGIKELEKQYYIIISIEEER
jgi:hypothetical protein